MRSICNQFLWKAKKLITFIVEPTRANPNLHVPKPSPTILARGNGKGGVCAIPHYNGTRRMSIRESACIQTFPESFEFFGGMNSCYRQIGNAVPVKFAEMLGNELKRIEGELDL